MNKLNLVLSIITFFRENLESKKTDLGFKNPLVLMDDGNIKLVIEKYYEYDVTIFKYKNGEEVKLVKKYQEYYADLSVNVLELIYAQIQLNQTDTHEKNLTLA